MRREPALRRPAGHGVHRDEGEAVQVSHLGEAGQMLDSDRIGQSRYIITVTITSQNEEEMAQ